MKHAMRHRLNVMYWYCPPIHFPVVVPSHMNDQPLWRISFCRWLPKVEDLRRSGCYQVPVQESNKAITVFITQDGLYEFQVSLVYLMNAPATFQRAMTNTIGHNRRDNPSVYLDDILISTRSFGKHLKHHVCETLRLSNHHNLMLNS